MALHHNKIYSIGNPANEYFGIKKQKRDNITRIQAGISELIRNKTVLAIAHRMRTVANADKIVVLDNGAVAESGSPEESPATKGIFAGMIAQQDVKNRVFNERNQR